ncbi:MAG: 3-methyl-2-oxobutanoate hydroxymethyltransferase [Paludibacteraceae bacterium]|jgi:3-methyl-2-oxobutanoate hydroxymethyltransferase|nr:3-methyl-2-oxobutanoate hydroxymethyltransferase [Paludibacteraceae bacterium]MEE3483021.1 3-methyl-2-oxobutanoate hydroxymethyltransferase [Bacteroidales bacterium]
MSVHTEIKKVTTSVLRKMKTQGEKISMLTSYDFSMASIVDKAGIDVILVGDSAANVMAGYPTTLLITLDQMIYHAQCVVRAVSRAHVVVDMPFGYYESSEADAVRSAARIMKESGADSLKIEGGEEVLPCIQKIINAGIPVMGHLGLMPQSVNQYGSYALRANNESEAKKLIEDAKKLEAAGCYALVLEKIPAELAKKVTESISIPTIGIGAGGATDGQVLVVHDMLGINKGFTPKFLRRYANLADEMTEAIQHYISDVQSGDFPNENEQY